MKLTRASSYALHAVAFMAQQKSEKPVASHNIASERDIPERFLLKVLKPLVSARVLRSVKGPNGGYELARNPSDISMLEIVEAVDGPIRGLVPVTERKKNPGAEKVNAALNGKLETICSTSADVLRKHLERVRISDLIAGKKDGADEKPSRRRAAAAARD